VSRLRDLMLGFVSGDEHTSLEQHVLSCAACTAAIEDLSDSDGLADALRQAGSARVPGGQTVQRAIERACQLGAVARVTGPGDTAVSVDETTEKKHASRPELARLIAQVLSPARSTDELGWLGPHRVLQLLGYGGMGLLFLAEDGQLQRRVALKVMQPRLAASPGARSRFLREGRAAAALKHDNIVTIYHVGEDHGVFWLAMELLEGDPLDRRLNQQGRLELVEAVRIGREVAEALGAAHSGCLIHRDIKPANIWLESPRQRVKVLDFGLARPAQDDAELTGTGDIVGTPAYMSPEQARGEPVDHRSDLFSLGCVLYRMVAGKTPFGEKDTMGTLLALATRTPGPVRDLAPDVPAALEALISKLLLKDPAGRPQTAVEVARELAVIEAGLVPGVSPPPPPVSHDLFPPLRTSGLVRRSRFGLLGRHAAVLVASAVVLGGLMLAGVLLEIMTSAGTIVIEVDQPEAAGAVVTVDGQQRVTIKSAESKEPIRVVADEKEHTLKVSKGGFETFTRRFTVQSGKSETIRVRLEPLRGVAGSTDSKVAPAAQSEASLASRPGDADRALMPWLHERGINIPIAQKIETGEYFDLPAGSEPPSVSFVLRKLEVVNGSRITADEIGRLAELPFLNELSMAGSALAIEVVPQIMRLDYVKRLYLARTNLRSSDLSDLQKMPLLYDLHLNGNLLDDDGAVLRNFPALRDVLISGTRPVKLPRLAEIPGLRTIRIQWATVDIDEVAELQRKNPFCRVIIRRNGPFKVLGRDPVRDAAIALLGRGIKLRGGPMGSGAGQTLTQAMLAEDRPYVVKEMIIPADVRLTAEDRELMPSLFGALDTVDASGTSGADELAAAIGKNQVYLNINFAKSDLTDAGLKHLQAIGGLEILNIRESRVTRPAVEAFHTAVSRCLVTSTFGVFKAIAPGANIRESALSSRGNFALEFNAKDSYVDIPTLRYDGSHPITLEATITPYQTQIRGDVFGNSNSTGIRLSAPGNNEPSRNVFVVKDSAGYQVIPSLEAYTPHQPLHVAAIVRGSSVRMYVEGKLQGSSELTGSYEPGNDPFLIGATPGINSAPMKSPFSGVIDELRVSKVARYTADFTPEKRFAPDKDTLALYHFDEGQGITLTDFSGNGHHGMIFNAKWVSVVAGIPQVAQPVSDEPDRVMTKWLHERGVMTSLVQRRDNGEYFNLPIGAQLPDYGFRLRRVTINDSATITNADLGRLAELPELMEITGNSRKLDGEAAKQLATLQFLEGLHVAPSNIPTSALVHLKRLPVLHRLHVNFKQVDDNWASLRDWSALRELTVMGKQTISLDLLGEYPRLRMIILVDGSLSLDQVERIQRQNSLCRVVTGKGPAGKVVGPDPVREAAGRLLARGLELQGLLVFGRPVGPLTQEMLDSGTAYQVTGLMVPRGTILTAEECGLFTRFLGSLGDVHAVGISGADALAAVLGEHSVFWKLDFSQSDLTDAGLAHLHGIVSLETLNVRRTAVSRMGVESCHAAVPRCHLISDFGVFPATRAAPLESRSPTKPNASGPDGKPTAVKTNGIDAVSPARGKPDATVERGSDRWVALLNGKDLEGWRTARLPKSTGLGRWQVDDGILTASDGPTRLLTTKELIGDFQFRVEVMVLPDEVENGGCCIVLCHRPTSDRPPLPSDYRLLLSKAQTENYGAFHLVSSAHDGARYEELRKPIQPIVLTPEKWYRVQVNVMERKIDVSMDGERVISYDAGDRGIPPGAIGFLAGRGSTMRIRNAEWRRLP